MKKLFIIIILSIFLAGCLPSDVDTIQSLKTELHICNQVLEAFAEKIHKCEN